MKWDWNSFGPFAGPKPQKWDQSSAEFGEFYNTLLRKDITLFDGAGNECSFRLQPTITEGKGFPRYEQVGACKWEAEYSESFKDWGKAKAWDTTKGCMKYHDFSIEEYHERTPLSLARIPITMTPNEAARLAMSRFDDLNQLESEYDPAHQRHPWTTLVNTRLGIVFPKFEPNSRIGSTGMWKALAFSNYRTSWERHVDVDEERVPITNAKKAYKLYIPNRRNALGGGVGDCSGCRA